MKKKVLRLFNLIKKGEIKFLMNGISKRLRSKNQVFGLKRDLKVDFKNPEALIDLSIRPFKAEDQDCFALDLQNSGLVEKVIPTCYVATTTEDIPCYRQWLMGPKQNDKIREFWGPLFPILKDDEALLESAFALPSSRGKRIMPAAMSRIAEKGHDLGVRWIITFVEIDNISSLKGCYRSGFSPYVLRTEKWFLFKRTVTFEDVPKVLMTDFFKVVDSSNSKQIKHL